MLATPILINLIKSHLINQSDGRLNPLIRPKIACAVAQLLERRTHLGPAEVQQARVALREKTRMYII